MIESATLSQFLLFEEEKETLQGDRSGEYGRITPAL